jgi:hypothetical protein
LVLSWTYRVIPSKFWTRYEEQTSWIYRVIPSKLNVLVLNIAEKLLAGCYLDGITLYVQLVLHVWFKTFGLNLPECSICQYFMSGSKLLDGIALHVGDSIQVLDQIWRTDKLNIQGDSIQIKCSRPSKPLDVITLYVQLVSTSCLVQNF